MQIESIAGDASGDCVARRTADARSAPLTTGREELLRGGDDRAFRALVHDLLSFGSRLRSIRDALGEHVGLAGSTYTTLISVAHLESDGDVNIVDLVRHLNLSQPFITSEVNRLQDRGLVSKRRSSVDRRAVVVSTTEQGRSVVAELAPTQRVINDALFAHVDRDTFDMLCDLVPRIVDDADAALSLAERLNHQSSTKSGVT